MNYKLIQLTIAKEQSKRHLYSMEFILEFVGSHLTKSQLRKTDLIVKYNPYGEFYNILIYSSCFRIVNKLVEAAKEILNKEYSR